MVISLVHVPLATCQFTPLTNQGASYGVRPVQLCFLLAQLVMSARPCLLGGLTVCPRLHSYTSETGLWVALPGQYAGCLHPLHPHRLHTRVKWTFRSVLRQARLLKYLSISPLFQVLKPFSVRQPFMLLQAPRRIPAPIALPTRALYNTAFALFYSHTPISMSSLNNGHKACSARTPPPINRASVAYVSAAKAASIDELLMSSSYGFSLPQLMELAGLAVAHAVVDLLPLPSHSEHTASSKPIVIVCGPGNNGGDGLVAARHLHHFGYDVCVVYPKRPSREPFSGLLRQLVTLGVVLVDDMPREALLVVDAVFGFSFDGKNGVRPPFRELIHHMNSVAAPLLAVDVPSGWHVDNGRVFDEALRTPEALISLTAPKQFAKRLDSTEENPTTNMVHYVGGRFVPATLCKELDFEVPQYGGIDLITRIA